MIRKPKLRRATLLIMIAAISTITSFFGAPSAHAGSWLVSFSVSPTATNGTVGTTTSTAQQSTMSTTEATCGSQGSIPSAGGQSLLSVNVTATLTWNTANPSNPASDPPPATVYMLETITPAATCSLNPPKSPSGITVALDDGVGDVSVAPYALYTTQSIVGKHLVQASVTNGTAVLPTCTIKAAASSGALGHAWTAFFNVTYQLNVDTRGVTLSRPGAVGETTDANGTVHGDTVYSIYSTTTISDPNYGNSTINTSTMNWQTFNANFVGNWGTTGTGQQAVPNVAWQWTPNESQDTVLNGLCEMPYSGIGYNNGVPFGTSNGPTVYNVSYTAVSNTDGAAATAKYVLTVHEPDEWQPVGSSVEVAPKDLDNEGPVAANGSVNLTEPPGEVDYSTGAKVGGGLLAVGASVLSMIVPEVSPVAVGLLTAGGYTLGLSSPPPSTIVAYQGTLAILNESIIEQNAINSGSTSGVFQPQINRISDKTLLAKLENSGQLNQYFNGVYGQMSFSVGMYQRQWQHNYTGTSYNANGATGPLSGDIIYPGSYEYIVSWTIAALPAPPVSP